MYDTTSMATTLDRCTSGTLALGDTAGSADPTPWKVRMTLGFRDTRGVERTIGIAGGMYDPEDLARGIAERMTTADGDATYTGTFADGRFTFATAGGQPFDLLMSGRFRGGDPGQRPRAAAGVRAAGPAGQGVLHERVSAHRRAPSRAAPRDWRAHRPRGPPEHPVPDDDAGDRAGDLRLGGHLPQPAALHGRGGRCPR